jgi:hypothetical protein
VTPDSQARLKQLAAEGKAHARVPVTA